MKSVMKYIAIAILLIVSFLSGIIVHKYCRIGWILKRCNIIYYMYSPFKAKNGIKEKTRIRKLHIRKFTEASTDMRYETERDSTYCDKIRETDLNRTALILIDVWKTHPNEGHFLRVESNRKTHIVPLLELARENKILVIHSPTGREIADDCKPIEGERIIDNISELDLCLKANNIKTLLYAGYSSNWCVLNKSTGIIRAYRYGYKVILMRDCTIAFEYPETIDEEWANKVAISMIETMWGSTTTLDDLKKALE